MIKVIDRLLGALIPDDALAVHALVDAQRYPAALDKLVTGLAACGAHVTNEHRAELITLMAAAGLDPVPAYTLLQDQP